MHPDTTLGLSNDLKQLKADLLDLNGKFISYTAGKDGHVIKFCRLGYRSFDEAGAWYELHAPKDSFGYLVDFYIVMENIFSSWENANILSKLQNLHKINVTELGQGIAMSFYETEIPKIVTKNKTCHIRLYSPMNPTSQTSSHLRHGTNQMNG